VSPWRFGFGAVIAAAALTAVAPAGAVAAAPAVAAARPSITLSAQPPWSKPGDDVLIRLGVSANTSTGLQVTAHIHEAVTSRLAFEQTVNGNRLGRTIATQTAHLADLPVVGNDHVFTLPLQDPGATRDSARVPLRVTGVGAVYPVEIELVDPESSTALSSFVTDLLLVPKVAPPATTDTRLRVGWLWRVASPPSTAPNGTVTTSFTRSTAPGGRLHRLVTALDASADIPITMVPTPETVEALNATPATRPLADRLRRTAGTVGVLAGTYTTIDGPSLAAGRLGDVLTTQLVNGRSVLERDLAAPVDHTVAAPQTLDPAWLGKLRNDAGTTRVIVHPNQLTDVAAADQYTPARPFRLETGIGGFDAIEVNPTTSGLLIRPGADALRAQQVLAALTVIALEQPTRLRGVVIDTPPGWDVRSDRVGAVVAGLRDSPILRTTDVGSIFDTVVASTTAGGRPFVRILRPITPAAPPVTPHEYDTAQSRIEALASMTRPSDPLVARLRQNLLLTPAAGVPGTGRRTTTARLDAIQNEVGAVVSGIEAPTSRTFRLTSRRATVPVSILNRANQALSVRVSLESKKLEFPNGSEQTVRVPPGDRNKTLQFDVAARASGTFPVLVTLSSPDGRLDLQRSRYTVRSSVISGVGLILTLGAALFLAAWWFRHWRRRRRATVAVENP